MKESTCMEYTVITEADLLITKINLWLMLKKNPKICFKNLNSH